MSDIHEEYQRQWREFQTDLWRVETDQEAARTVIPRPVVVLKPRAIRQGDQIEIASIDLLGLKTPDGQPIDDKMLQRMRGIPGLLFVLDGVVYQEAFFRDQFFVTYPYLSSFPEGDKDEIMEGYLQLLDEAKTKLADQIIRNQKNTLFADSEEKAELTSQLHFLIEKAEQRGEPQEERSGKKISSGPLKTTHTELTTAEGGSVWVDTDIYKQGSSGKFEQRHDLWGVAAEGIEDRRDIHPEARPGKEVRISTIITVDRMYQLGEGVHYEMGRETPADQFWFRMKPGHGVPLDFEKETGIWGIEEATRHEWNPKSLPANEHMVRQVIGKLESALSHSSGGTP